MYFNAAGPFGEFIEKFIGAVVGMMRYVMPIVFIALGGYLIKGHRQALPATEGPSADEAEGHAAQMRADRLVRFSIGSILILMAACGFWHLGRSNPTLSDNVIAFEDSGGLLGWLIAGVISKGITKIGALISTIALLLIGLVILTDSSLHSWFSYTSRTFDRIKQRSAQNTQRRRARQQNRHRRTQSDTKNATATDSAAQQTATATDTAGEPATQGPAIFVGGKRLEPQHGDTPASGQRPTDDNDLNLGYLDAQLDGKTSQDAPGHKTAEVKIVTPAAKTQNRSTDSSRPQSFKEATEAKQSLVTPEAKQNLVTPPAQPETKPAKRRKVTPKITVADLHADHEEDSGSLEDEAKVVAGSNWKLPPISLLNSGGDRQVDQAAVKEAGDKLEAALASHGVDAHLVGMVVGPTVTRFELELGEGVKVARITSLNKDIAYAMASADVRILAPIPGRRAIGVEVPNEQRQVVALGDLLRSREARKAKHPLEVAVGRDIQGKAMLMNLAKMPHLLIAGATGSGKSSCINSIITSILMRSTPKDVRMILVDPKMVEMTQYERVPHLLTQPVTDPRKAANALAWACREMDRRYQLLADKGFRDIAGFNKACDEGQFDEENAAKEANPEDNSRPITRLPYILVVVDELADLMMVAARDVEDSICRIAQKARAIGIHLVIATQRPSTNVITGIIKANVPARMAFSVSSLTDSRVILDQPGAERLIGRGDLLMLSPTSSAPDRIQGCWVEEDEVRAVVGNWREQAELFKIDQSVTEAEIIEGETKTSGTAAARSAGSGSGATDDELYERAHELVISSQLGSTSMLQRKLKVGFARAGRLMDLLEENGIVGPSVGSKAREVLVSEADL